MDLIDRQAVIDKICDTKCFIGRKFCTHLEPCEDIRIIESVPTVEPKRGEWTEPTIEWLGNVAFILKNCSTCDSTSIAEIRQGNEVLIVQNHYCHNCGADMRGAADE